MTAWLARDVFGLPEGAGGLMTSGGAASNFTALKAARDLAGGPDTRRHGVQGKRVAMYTTAEAHATNAEAADMLGLGSDAMRIVAAGEDLRMLPDALDHALSTDISAGVRPAAVIASAGTTATGAIDPLNAVADVCAHHRVWLHVDAAYGGAAMLAPGLRPLLAGIERADSIAFDPHKWLYTPQPSACLLVRDPSVLRSSFSIDVDYVRDDPGLSGRGTNIGELGQAWSRPWMALKVWLSLLAHGTDAYARRIQHDVELAHYLHERAAAFSDLEPIGAVTLSIACFRYVPEDLSGGDHNAYLNRLNERLMTEIRRKGRTFPSNAELDGRYALRACIVNFRTEAGDIDALLEDARTLGAQLDAELR